MAETKSDKRLFGAFKKLESFVYDLSDVNKYLFTKFGLLPIRIIFCALAVAVSIFIFFVLVKIIYAIGGYFQINPYADDRIGVPLALSQLAFFWMAFQAIFNPYKKWERKFEAIIKGQLASQIFDISTSGQVDEIKKKFILYLRPFFIDRSGEKALLKYARAGFVLDDIVGPLASKKIDVVKIGRVQGSVGALGHLEFDDNIWFEVFMQLCDRAERIVMVPIAQEATLSELKYISEAGFLGKTVFLMPKSENISRGAYRLDPEYSSTSQVWGHSRVVIESEINIKLPHHNRRGGIVYNRRGNFIRRSRFLGSFWAGEPLRWVVVNGKSRPNILYLFFRTFWFGSVLSLGVFGLLVFLDKEFGELVLREWGDFFEMGMMSLLLVGIPSALFACFSVSKNFAVNFLCVALGVLGIYFVAKWLAYLLVRVEPSVLSDGSAINDWSVVLYYACYCVFISLLVGLFSLDKKIFERRI